MRRIPPSYNFTVLLRIALVTAIALVEVARGDENLKTPYIMLDPSALPPPATPGEPITVKLRNPAESRRLPSDLGLPTIKSVRDDAGEHVTLANAALSLRLTIAPSGRAAIKGL
ncbi:MAG: hypothetical protein ABIP55_06040, partial [Tepidisphaeraceae bacterium]